MITEHMQLRTISDASQWADSMLSGISSNDYDYDRAVELLAKWIWDNKPKIGCVIADHPVNDMPTDEFWDIISEAELD